MRKKLTTILLILPFMALTQFQPIQKADWTLWDRNDHKMHMFAGQVSMWLPQLVLTYADMDNPDFKRPLKFTLPLSLGLVVGKEYLIDRAFGLGKPTYPDLIYGITGTATGLLFSFALYKIHEWDVKRIEKLKL